MAELNGNRLSVRLNLSFFNETWSIKLNPYETLNINNDASDEDVKASYKKLAQKHHPDRGGDQEQFQAIQEAYDLLKNHSRRSQYDKDGTTEKAPDINVMARSRLAVMCEAMLAGITLDLAKSENLVKLAHKNINAAEADIRAKISKLENERRTWEEVAKRCGGENNIIHGLAGQKVEQINRNLDALDHDLKIIPMMREMLDGATYSVDRQEHINFAPWFSSTPGGGGGLFGNGP